MHRNRCSPEELMGLSSAVLAAAAVTTFTVTAIASTMIAAVGAAAPRPPLLPPELRPAGVLDQGQQFHRPGATILRIMQHQSGWRVEGRADRGAFLLKA